MFLSPMGDPHGVTIVDVQAQHKIVGFIPFSESVRPPALSADTAFLFQHVDGLNGFEVASVHQRKVIATVEHSTDKRIVRHLSAGDAPKRNIVVEIPASAPGLERLEGDHYIPLVLAPTVSGWQGIALDEGSHTLRLRRHRP